MSSILEAIDDLAKTLIVENYGTTDPELIALYERAKVRQWNGTLDLPWQRPYDGPIMDTTLSTLHGTGVLAALSLEDQMAFHRAESAWVLSQFLHGEQASLLACGQLMASLPELDSKFYAASQGYDEARHVEVYKTYLMRRFDRIYPANENLIFITHAALGSPEWVMKLVGTQLIVESLAMGAFKTLLDAAIDPLLRELLTYVMQDEARHVAFGRIALKKAVSELSPRDREDYEDFVYYACEMMSRGFIPEPVYREFGITVTPELLETIHNSEQRRRFRRDLFSVLLPHSRAIGLLTERIEPRYAALGILEYATAPVDMN